LASVRRSFAAEFSWQRFHSWCTGKF